MLSAPEGTVERHPELFIPSDVGSNGGPSFRVLTAPARGAIAVIRVWGRGAIQAVGSAFRANSEKPLEQSTPGRLLLGRMGAGRGDEVVAVVLETVIPAVEIQCHGGKAAVRMVLESLKGAAAEHGQRWELPGFDYVDGDLLASEALEDLGLASTVLTAEVLLDQVHGALRAEITRLADLVEREPMVARAGLEAMVDRGTIGLRLLSGWKVVIAGRPNVGKSRLLNALCGFSRAIVDSTPGTTRDVVAFQTALGGWPVEIADTAGRRATNHAIEREGIERAERELGIADLVLLVVDRSESLRPIDRRLIATTRKALVVANKSDLQPAWADGDPGLGTRTAVAVSAERGDGMNALVAAMIERIVTVAPVPGEAIPFRPRHMRKLGKARDELLAANTARAAHELET